MGLEYIIMQFISIFKFQWPFQHGGLFFFQPKPWIDISTYLECFLFAFCHTLFCWTDLVSMMVIATTQNKDRMPRRISTSRAQLRFADRNGRMVICPTPGHLTLTLENQTPLSIAFIPLCSIHFQLKNIHAWDYKKLFRKMFFITKKCNNIYINNSCIPNKVFR